MGYNKTEINFGNRLKSFLYRFASKVALFVKNLVIIS